MNLEQEFNVFTLYVYSTGINLLIAVILFLLYFNSRKREHFILDFGIGFLLILLGTLSITFSKYYDFTLAVSLGNGLSISGFAFIGKGFLPLIGVKTNKSHNYPLFSGLLLALIIYLFELDLNERTVGFSILSVLIFSYYLRSIYRYAANRTLTKTIHVTFSLLIGLHVFWAYYALGQPSANLINEYDETQKLLFLILIIIVHLFSAQIFIGIGIYFIDFSKKMSERNKLLMNEMNHRINNSLNRLIGMIQSMSDESAAGQESFKTLQTRIFSISKVHEQLYKQEQNTRDLPLDVYLPELVRRVLISFEKPNVQLSSDIYSLDLNSDQSLFLGIIVNELAINSCKYAFNDNEIGNIKLKAELQKNTDHVLLKITYEDDGPGYHSSDIKGYGSNIIEESLAFLKAKSSIDTNGKFKMEILFPVDNKILNNGLTVMTG
mgnify:CR=1 FL=1